MANSKNLPQERIVESLQVIREQLGASVANVSGYPTPEKRIADTLDGIAEKVIADGGVYTKVPMKILGTDEYDTETGVPTITDPQADVFYLVPSTNSDTEDMFEEWVYINDNWEHFGAGGNVQVPQSDWAQTTETATDYIKNKPPIAKGTNEMSPGVASTGCICSGAYSVALGGGCNATQDGTVAIGGGCLASASAAVAIGNGSQAKGMSSLVLGGGTASGANSVAMVGGTASETNSFAAGSGCQSKGYAAFAFGGSCIASGEYSVAIGGGSSAEKEYSVSIGGGCVAQGDYSVAMGGGCYATDRYSVAIGSGNRATKVGAVAFGGGSQANGDYSCAIGNNNFANGRFSFATGVGAHAQGDYSIALGLASWANNKSQLVFGENNILDESKAESTERGTYIEIVGNGSGHNNRSNARTLDWAGSEWLAGNLAVAGGVIRVGETTITEAQLQSLLALLDQPAEQPGEQMQL